MWGFAISHHSLIESAYVVTEVVIGGRMCQLQEAQRLLRGIAG